MRPHPVGMRTSARRNAGLILIVLPGILALLGRAFSAPLPPRASGKKTGLSIAYPHDGTIFPQEIPPPHFIWSDDSRGVNAWRVRIRFSDAGMPMESSATAQGWTPSGSAWEDIKKHSLEKPAQVTVTGYDAGNPGRGLSRSDIAITTSKDLVEDSIFYRELPLPFKVAFQNPTRTVWRFGAVSSSAQPPVVLEKLSPCGNCHSFSGDGKLLGMASDHGHDTGSYMILETSRTMTISASKLITWTDYRRQDNQETFGLLPSLSPDGRHVLATVKDMPVVFVVKPDLYFSEIFFPVQGIIAVYSREQKIFSALPGADDPSLVQSNPVWSPDGRDIVFARSVAYPLKSAVRSGFDSEGLPPCVCAADPDCAKFIEGKKPFRYDLYRIPFNDGKGGKAEPIVGASHNGMSNYFPKISPDGKWLVFCQARNFMMLNPDSVLHIVPASGGRPRKMRCNTPRMNSWHSWSSNSRWLVFASKANTAYTQLFLTHIDADGQDSPPVLLENFTVPDLAANMPEFVPLQADAIQHIRDQFVEDPARGAMRRRRGAHQFDARQGKEGPAGIQREGAGRVPSVEDTPESGPMQPSRRRP